MRLNSCSSFASPLIQRKAKPLFSVFRKKALQGVLLLGIIAFYLGIVFKNFGIILIGLLGIAGAAFKLMKMKHRNE